MERTTSRMGRFALLAADDFAKSYDQGTCDGIAQDCFIAGAEWQKEQMMDEWLKDRDGCFWDGVEEGKKAMEKQMLKAWRTAKAGKALQEDCLIVYQGEEVRLGRVAIKDCHYLPVSEVLKYLKEDSK